MSHVATAAGSRRGQVHENPVTGERAVIVTDPLVHPAGVLVAHLLVRPGGRVALEHSHPTIRERFHLLAGRIAVSVDGHQRVLGAGEHAEVPPGARHDWWQVGGEEAQALVEVDPGARFIEMVGALWGLARDGRTRGRPVPGPLQMAVIGAAYRDTLVASSPPVWVQRTMFATLAPLGRLFGLRAAYPEYERSATVVDPDPAVLALLAPDGRLAWDTDSSGARTTQGAP